MLNDKELEEFLSLAQNTEGSEKSDRNLLRRNTELDKMQHDQVISELRRIRTLPEEESIIQEINSSEEDSKSEEVLNESNYSEDYELLEQIAAN